MLYWQVSLDDVFVVDELLHSLRHITLIN